MQYVHGYDYKENTRLQDQAQTLSDILHSGTSFPAGSKILEAGCGVGAQTIPLAANSPEASIISIDISEESLKEAKRCIEDNGITNVTFQQGDILSLNFEEGFFDHVFVCFVLEHLKNPVEALLKLKRLIKPGGTITIIEGDHGSAYFYPDNKASQKAINCQIELQKISGGNANIGRELYPIIYETGFSSISVSPLMIYVDASKPHLVEGFIKQTFTAMIEGIREKSIKNGLIDKDTFDKGIQGLYKTTGKDGTFCYTFFKATALKD